MEETYKTLKIKVQHLMDELKDLSDNYKLKKFNIEIVLNNTSNNENITLKVDEENNLVVSKSKDKEEAKPIDEEKPKPKDKEEAKPIDEEKPKLTETVSEGGSLKTISSENTLSTSIFRTSVIDESENLKTEDFDLSHNNLNKNTRINSRDKMDNLRGGFNKKQELEKIELSTSEQSMSSTSELRTTMKNIVGLQGGNNLMSETSDFKPNMKNEKISATSLSATSDYKVDGRNNTYSATSLSATSDYKVDGRNNTYSATSLSATSDYKVDGRNNTYSATSDKKVGGGNLVYSATSDINNNFGSSKMDMIKQKLRELESSSDKNVFRKTKFQSGGNRPQAINTDKLKQMKQTIGINSSSTSSLCE